MQSEKNVVFVGNVSFGLDKDQLAEIFSKYGNVIEVSIPLNRETGRPRGFAFVKFDSDSSAQEALAEDGKEHDGRNIRVNIALGKQEGTQSRGPRTGGSSQSSGGGFRRNNNYR